MLGGLPVMSLIPQLLLKLQGWADHRESGRADMRAKLAVDVADINALLDIAVEWGMHVRASDVAAWLPRSMIRAAEGTLLSYMATVSRSTMHKWRRLGLTVSPP